MKVTVGAKTDVGRVREANEDSFLLNDPLFVVADGMGGHVAGDVASSTAVETIKKQSSSDASADDMETLARLVSQRNSQIWEKAQGDPTLRGMGTTCTLLLLDVAKAHFAHVGDSRAYLLRGGHPHPDHRGPQPRWTHGQRGPAHRSRKPRATRSAASSPGVGS